MNTKEPIEQVIALSVEACARVTDVLLRSLNAPPPDIDAQCATDAKRRLSELRSGKVEAIPGEAAFERVRERLGR